LNRVATQILAFQGNDEKGNPLATFHHGDYESNKEWK
jgi:hypothetical protein